jgi:hypothetical protein
MGKWGSGWIYRCGFADGMFWVVNKPQITYETPSKTFLVMREGKGLYRVYKNDGVAATICATFHYSSNSAKASSLAIERANRLEEIKFGGM